jgi:surfactin synthase thioesterase subunit
VTGVQDAARVTLICLPHAGGTPAAYQGWAGSLAPGIDMQPVQLPRPDDGKPSSVQETAAVLAGKLSTATARPYAFFGHSLGAIAAFETIRALLNGGFPPPVRLFSSGSAAPHIAAAAGRDLHRLADKEFLDEVGRLGGLPAEVTTDSELRQAFLPGLRADYMLAETYEYEPGPPLPCPISVFRGQSDPFVDPGQLQSWDDYTTGKLRARTVPGGHFLLQGSAAFLHRAIRKDLDSDLG